MVSQDILAPWASSLMFSTQAGPGLAAELQQLFDRWLRRSSIRVDDHQDIEVLQRQRDRSLEELLKLEGTRWGPRWIAKLVYNSNVTMVYGTYNYSIHGVYKPSYNWGAPPCSQQYIRLHKALQLLKCYIILHAYKYTLPRGSMVLEYLPTLTPKVI